MAFPIEPSIIVTYSLTVATAIHSIKFRGAFKTLIFLLGAIIVAGAGENLNIITAAYIYPGSALMIYYYRAPLDICFGWFVILYCCSFFSHTLIGKGEGSFLTIGIGTTPKSGMDKKYFKRAILRSAFAGLIAVNFDMFMDPVAVYNNWWVWSVYSVYFMGIPLSNYAGWFLIFFWYLLFYDLIITYCSVINAKKHEIAAFWIVGCILALICSGAMFFVAVLVLGLEGIRNGGTTLLHISLTQAVIVEVVMVGMYSLINITLILLCSLAPNQANSNENLRWRKIPSIIMLMFWGSLVIVAIFSRLIILLIGFTHDLLFLAIAFYLLIKAHIA